VSVGDWISLAVLALGSGVLGAMLPGIRRVSVMAEDWRGRPERRDPMTGVVIDAGRASLPGRLAALEAQVSPNGGKSMHDQVSKLVLAVEQFDRRLQAIEERQTKVEV
jgi:hypothetical protein